MINLLHLSEIMTCKWVYETDLKVTFDEFEKFAKRNNFTILSRIKNGHRQLRLRRESIPIMQIESHDSDSTFSFMDIADLHIGHPDFNEAELRAKLKYAVDNNIQYVFIAGDIFEGCTDATSESHYYEQVQLAYDIFKDYSLNYFAINGNHDYTFEQIGLVNPIKRLEQMLNNVWINFFYFDTYVMDFIICGVIKRVMHVERQDFNKKKIFAQEKLAAFDKEGFLENSFQGETYPVRFFEVGHIHVNVQMYYSKKKIFISQPGCFLGKNNHENANIIKGKVIGQKVFMS